MKILVSTYVLPSKRNIRTTIFNNIFSSLKNKANLDVVWVLFQPDKFSSTNHRNESLLDIHDFNDAISMLNSVNPDCIMITSAPDTIQYALCIAAKHLNIPIFSIYIYSKQRTGSENNYAVHKGAKHAINNFLSNKVPGDTVNQYKFFRRGKFIMYKNKFLFNTLRKSGTNYMNSLTIPCKNTLTDVTGKSKNYNNLADYHILPDNSWIFFLTSIGIDKESIFVTGNPYWEGLDNTNNLELKKFNSQNPIRLLVVTDSLLEHNFWSEKQRISFINKLVLNLQKDSNLIFSFKIHPSSEDLQSYIKLFQDHHNPARIFQSENLSTIINDFDLALSYGSTGAHTEIIANYTKLILIDMKMNSKPHPLVEEGIACGLVTVCGSIDGILGTIHDCLDKKITISNDLVTKRNSLFSKNNKSSEQIADILMKKLVQVN